MIPARADPDEQIRYLEQEIEPRLAQAQAGQRAVFFGDAAHFVLAPFLGFLWSVVRVFLLAPAGRQRFNVWGVNALTRALITVSNDTYLTAQSVCELLHQLAAFNLGVALAARMRHPRGSALDFKLRCVEELEQTPLNAAQKHLLVQAVDTFLPLAPEPL